MSQEMEQIAQRIKGLRESLDLSVDQFATACDISIEEYKEYESGQRDMTISLLKRIAKQYGVDVTTLMFDDEPRMSSYFVTRKGTGMEVNRISAYKYQTLAGGFSNREADVFEVTIEPCDNPIHISCHEGQEFNLVLEGKMQLQINGKNLVLDEGDSIYFDSKLPHGMKALDNKKVKFITVIL